MHGVQTSGNILESPQEYFQLIKNIIISKVEKYNQLKHINTDKNFKENWNSNMYSLRGWAIIMNHGGNLKSHNHEKGWLTGTLYLQIPESRNNGNEGAIEFSHEGPKYPKGNNTFEKKIIRPKQRDLNIFCSSLYHKTLPFYSKKQRICIAFDIAKRE